MFTNHYGDFSADLASRLMSQSVARRSRIATAAFIKTLVANSVHFTLPNGGNCILSNEDAALPDCAPDFLRLPYPVTVLQYREADTHQGLKAVVMAEVTPAFFRDMRKQLSLNFSRQEDVPGSKRITLNEASVADSHQIDDPWIALFMMHELPSGEVRTPFSIPFFRRSSIRVKNGKLDFGDDYEYVAVDPKEMLGRMMSSDPNFSIHDLLNGLTDELLNDGGDIERMIEMALDFCLTVNCSNVGRKLVVPDEAVNRKRRKQRELLLSEFYLLQFPHGDTVYEDSESTGVGVRYHMRRRHIRHLGPNRERLTWVKAHAVGRRELGTVVKDFVVD